MHLGVRNRLRCTLCTPIGSEGRYFTPALYWYRCCVGRWLTLHIVLGPLLSYSYFPCYELLYGQAASGEIALEGDPPQGIHPSLIRGWRGWVGG